jgi:DNA primase small subunit
MDAGLREDFGFKHILWVYSGRRGVHCWVVDEAARQLNDNGRTAVANYFTIVSGGEGSAKKVTSLGTPLHYALQRAYDFLEPLFREHVIGEQGQQLLTDRTNWNKVSTCDFLKLVSVPLTVLRCCS